MKKFHFLFMLFFSPALCFNEFAVIALERELFEYFQANKANDWYEHFNTRLTQLPHEASSCFTDTNLLFAQWPGLKGKIPYISFGNLPTPVQKLHAISTKKGVSVYIKQDGLSGGFDAQGKSLYGGNKIRKLEFLLAQARHVGAQKVMTFGCAGSNHTVATSVHAHQMGMKTICMLLHQPSSQGLRKNLLLHLDYETELHFNANNELRQLNAFFVWLEQYKKDGHPPYIIPTGGSNAIGTIGFVNAAFELAEQIKQGLLPKPSHIYVACGSCGTTAGLLLGCMAAGIDVDIVALAVHPASATYFPDKIAKLFNETNALLHNADPSFPLFEFPDNHLIVDLRFGGSRYGLFSDEGIHAYQELLDLEHIQLDGTYSAKAFAGLLETIKPDSHTSVLFWNTFCSTSTKRTPHDYSKLPACLHDYFEETTIQTLDRAEIA